MPRPTAAQYFSGSATVVVSALVLLLLLGVESGPGVAVVCAVSMVLGLLVALALPGRSATAPTTAAPTITVRAHRTAEDMERAARRERVGGQTSRR
ncbi:hypothetical protein AB0M42_30155 [Streptomyces sp. NPDC051784]|uniref:hypothetical protein n=1 Tax=Streptomyces sp. NPDC051784 TaxID=3155805 RepID=UPI0034449E10